MARVFVPQAGRPGSIGSAEWATFFGEFDRGSLNFTRGTYVEIELRGNANACVEIDDWDPQISCEGACHDLTGEGGVSVRDFLLLLAECGRDVSGQDHPKRCLDSKLSWDQYVDIDDILAWDSVMSADPPPLNLCEPPLPPGVSLPSTLTDKGDPRLGPDSIDVVFFLDSYHLLFHGKVLLEKICQRLAPHGCIYVLDRRSDRPLVRREASHRRMIRAETVEREMAEAGLSLWFRGPGPSADRFLLVFGKAQAGKTPPKVDPFFGGPEISQPPKEWLKDNYWRLRGLKTADGRHLTFAGQKPEGPVEILPADVPGEQSWRIPGEKVVLSFEAKGKTYLLSDYQSLEGR